MQTKKGVFNEILNKVDKFIKEEELKPFKVSIMGQTGVGKSSLLNALFNTNLKTDPVKPCTKVIEEVQVKFNDHSIWFYDLPGIGESEIADSAYLSKYKEHLLNSDVVLWAIHSDNRSVTFDVNSLTKLLEESESKEKKEIISKITFVLTKVDLLNYKPWILARNKSMAFFFPDDEVEEILNNKIEYYFNSFSQLLINQNYSITYNDCNFKLSLPNFSYNEQVVKFNGILTLSQVSNLSREFPDFKSVFERLSIKNKIIPCSSGYKYNLPRLLLSIADKIQGNGSIRFKNFISNIESIDKISYLEALNKFNLRILDIVEEKTIFDISKKINNIKNL